MATKQKQYLFLHIPKTAGTSFRTMLHHNFNDNDIYPKPETQKLNEKPYSNLKLIKLLSEDSKKDLKLINGHFPYYVKNYFDDPFTILFLRCPIKRTLSNILHFKSYIKRYKSKSVAQLLDELPLIQTSNAYTRYLGAVKKINKTNEVTSKDFRKAMENLATVDFVGDVEKYEDEINRLSKLTGMKLDVTVRKNVNNKKYKISPGVYREIVKRNEYDLALYHKYLYESK